MDRSPVALTVPSCLRAAAADSPDVEAVVDGDLRLTYPALHARAEQFARALIAAGVRPGEAVSIWAPNSAQWIVAALGTLAAGAVLVPINTRCKGAEAHYLLAKARVLLVVDQGFLGNDYLGMLRSAGAGPGGPAGLPGLPFLRTVVTVKPSGDREAMSAASFLDRACAVGPDEVDERIAAVTPDTLCDIVFTSGTSGTPKGVMTSHVSPEIMGMGPVEASRRALANAGMSVDDIDLVEVNEAFAAQVLPCIDELKLEPDKVNVHGGGIALGHPFGQTGARLTTTLINGLRFRDAHTGLVTMCAAGGQGMALVLERLS